MADQLQTGQSQSQGQAIADREEARNTFGNGALGETSGGGAGLSVSDPETPDTTIADANDPSTRQQLQVKIDALGEG